MAYLSGRTSLTTVQTDDIAADAVTNAKLADDAVDSEHYADGSIDNAHIADDAIDSEHYADGSIDEAHLADNAVTLAKMAGGTDGNLISYDTNGDVAAVATGDSGQILTSNGAGAAPTFQAAAGGGMTQATAQASTSGTAIDFTSLPAGLTVVHILFEDVSLSSTDTVLIQLGDAGGFETSGYAGRGAVATVTPAIIYTSNSSGIATRMYEPGYQYSGVISLMLQDAANTWVWGGTYVPEQDKMAWSAGNKTLSGELTQIRVTRSGSNTFDSGSINLLYM